MSFFQKATVRDFTKERYLAMVKAFPKLREEKTQAYFMLSLTFISLSILGVFAINPTLSTIIELNKKLEDSIFVSEALKTKMNNLSALHAEHAALKNSWPVVEAAVPNDPRTTYILGQMQQIAKDTGVEVVDLQAFQVELSRQGKPTLKEASFVFSVSVEGNSTQQLQFLDAVTTFDRVVAIESIALTNETTQVLTIRARAFFTP